MTVTFSSTEKKVCIVGFQPSATYEAPWPESAFLTRARSRAQEQHRQKVRDLRAKGPWEIWGFNGLYREIDPKNFTRWFELHAPGKDLGQRGWIEPWDELHAVSEYMPLYLTTKERRVPKALVYPKAKVEALTPHGAYHCGSFDWMVAFAILEGFTHIRIVGVDFQAGGEPISARPCLEYWCGVAEGRGITTEIIGGDCYKYFHLVRSDIQYGFDGCRLVEDRQ